MCLLHQFGYGQHRNFKTWTVADGLPQSNLYAIHQDSRGFIWIGTGAGLSRFDGKNFNNYGKTEGFKGSVIRCIMEDSKQRLWFGTNAGIVVYDGFIFRQIAVSQGLKGSTVLCLMEDPNGSVWAGTDDGGLNHIEHFGTDSLSISVYSEENQLSSNTVFGLTRDRKGNVWAATFGGLNILNKVNGGYLVRVVRGEENIPSDLLISIQADPKGNIWVGSYNSGVFKIIKPDVSEKQLEVERLMLTDSLAHASVWDIIHTQHNETWIATGQQGIVRIKQDSLVASYTTASGLASNQVLSLWEDIEHNIWIGTNGDGLCLYSGDRFSHFTMQDGLPVSNVLSLAVDSLGLLWAATDGGGLYISSAQNASKPLKIFNQNDGLSSGFLTSLAIGRGGNRAIWMGSSNKGVYKYDGKSFSNFTTQNGLDNDRVNAVFVDRNGIVWVGTANGISRFDGKRFVSISTDEMKMNNEGVNAIIDDHLGNIWFATAGGLARYSGKGVLRTFDEVEGLNSKEVNAIAADAKGNIWIGTNADGLYFFDHTKPDSIAVRKINVRHKQFNNSVQSLVFMDDKTLIAGTVKGFASLKLNESGNVIETTCYDKSDGFVGVECNPGAIARDANGNVWFGTVKGITRYSPKSGRIKKIQPKLHLEHIQLFYEDVDWKSTSDSIQPWFGLPKLLQLTHNENNLTFRFVALSYSNPDKIRYRFRLLGQDDKWSPEQPENEARFSGLSDGTYTFSVMAAGADNIWSEPLTYTFTIHPPWYKTKMAIGGSIVGVVLLVVVVVKYREQQLQKEKRALEKIVAERTAEVVHQKEEIEEQKKEIVDSINYAQRIQFAILPPIESIQAEFAESFVLFKPKDIVAGDFYWMQVQNNTVFIAAADCTGHGVPGAMVSVVCSNALNRAVNEFGLMHTGEILDKTKELVVETFEKSQQEVKDGMDISMLSIERGSDSTFKVEWSGANNALFYMSGEELLELKATKQPIGKTDQTIFFTTHNISITQPTTFYLFTDGYLDQFGKDGKKLMKKRFRELIEQARHLSMQEQQQLFDAYVEDWKAGTEQTDDITVIGIKLRVV